VAATAGDGVRQRRRGERSAASGDGQGGGYYCQVGLDRSMRMMEDRSRRQVVLTHPERLLHLPQLVIGADDELGRGDLGEQVGDVGLVPGQIPRFCTSSSFKERSSPVTLRNRFRFTGARPAMAFFAFSTC